ncbi:hypothetical protein EVAR_51450_1 [Eumeta japonica]|uniref:Uncharacterized protein n=1 Tax=Eumeta variegata TaxID=151549 RepID=A0A4C1XV52_EUMVA|nr:hypothetical protein EVAR_51450_1 [Eumeta japonica]
MLPIWLQYKNVSARPVKYNSVTEHGREVAASAFAFRLDHIDFPSIRYPNTFQEAKNALVTPPTEESPGLSISLKTYACRMIYIGEHTLPKDELINLYRTMVFAVNGMYCDVRIGGLLLVYDSYFIHVVEGSEDTIYRLLRFVTSNAEELERAQANHEEPKEGLASINIVAESPEPEKKIFKALKMIVTYHSIRKLQFSSWRALYARPPALVTRPNVRAPLAQHMEQLRIFLNKIWKLIDLAVADKDLTFENLSTHDPKIEALPEVALLDFLLQRTKEWAKNQSVNGHRRPGLSQFQRSHQCVAGLLRGKRISNGGRSGDGRESVWPLPTHNTPQHLYKLKIDDSFVDPLPVMPWELVRPEKAEGEEEQSSSSSD